MNVDTYRQLEPSVATQEVESSGASTALYAIIGIVLVLAFVFGFWWLLRRRNRSVEV